MSIRSFALAACCVLGVVGLTGCGGSGLDATVPVDGVITYKGKPLEHYQVDFVHEDASKRTAAGITDEKGHFVLGTNLPGDGAVVGKHKVVVTFVGPGGPVTGIDPAAETAPPPRPKFEVPEKYQDVSRTDISVEVAPGGSPGMSIDIK